MRSSPFLIIGNWKSNKTLAEATNWWKTLSEQWSQATVPESLKVILAPSFIHIHLLHQYFSGSAIPIQLASQTLSSFENGAYTGEVNASMLSGLVQYTLIGHSERRKYFEEKDEDLHKKVLLAKKMKIEPIYCIQSPTQFVPPEVTIVGYEPVWAIGTGKAETAENAAEAARQIKKARPEIKVVYGGSVNAENVKTYYNTDLLDGVLPGGASLDPTTFFTLIRNAYAT